MVRAFTERTGARQTKNVFVAKMYWQCRLPLLRGSCSNWRVNLLPSDSPNTRPQAGLTPLAAEKVYAFLRNARGLRENAISFFQGASSFRAAASSQRQPEHSFSENGSSRFENRYHSLEKRYQIWPNGCAFQGKPSRSPRRSTSFRKIGTCFAGLLAVLTENRTRFHPYQPGNILPEPSTL
jgi:hypothetical protein